MTADEVSVIYDAVLSVPGMEDTVKINLSISRKKVLLLSQVIEAGLKAKDGSLVQLIASLPKEAAAEIKMLKEECLDKAGLIELDKKLSNLALKQ
ncbi:hypothetical protein [Pedobacter nutrimenti]|uniref:hypothetical protein n=1 Tax=Pedobacter nutrimenti TaxID=1241337 RepID=UPI0029316F76|nr:hypothetical protein [Pedobacter nutrimenti]